MDFLNFKSVATYAVAMSPIIEHLLVLSARAIFKVRYYSVPWDKQLVEFNI